jgi:hypothetical protein
MLVLAGFGFVVKFLGSLAMGFAQGKEQRTCVAWLLSFLIIK